MLLCPASLFPLSQCSFSIFVLVLHTKLPKHTSSQMIFPLHFQAVFISVFTAKSTFMRPLSFPSSWNLHSDSDSDSEWGVCQFSWERNRSSPFNIVFSALELDERHVIDFSCWCLLCHCTDNYERIRQSKQQTAFFCFLVDNDRKGQLTLCSNFGH